ncbi:MAG: hypothetical protein N3A69_11685, partial [Leptospiraceae bacterium]|nr:hypothetical protein [Leptospiraceae bacterium]
ITICLSCKHFLGKGFGDFRCKAFPHEIPSVFSALGQLHDKPYLGDNGFQFEPKEKETEPTTD